ncbi:MAG: phosphoglycerate kinase [Puniceicoccales bacterium]|jgi:3-phosphoglycerate kinase|nr:phosphoglycerate kinase [Puniceicoccales bacterium]
MDGVKGLKELPVGGKRVFVRVDFNVPLDSNGEISDNTRITATLPTVRYLAEEGAKVILASHLGRPKGKRISSYSLKPVAAELARLLHQPVLFLENCVGPSVEESINDMAESSVSLLENLRFHAEEEANDPGFSRSLARLADVYVNDAFGTAHRAHASTYGMVPHVPFRGVGFLMEKEIRFLVDTINKADRPFCVILGGAKVSDKIGVLEALLDKTDTLLVGGAMAYTFALAKGQSVGKSLTEPDKVTVAAAILKKASEKGVDLHLPVDWVAASEVNFDHRSVGELKIFEGGVPEAWQGVDIGPKTVEIYTKILERSKTILWNGPVGIFEIAPCAAGTLAIAEAMAQSSALTIVGGGDCVKAVGQSGVADKITFLSTGGGASLELLEGKPLPGIEILKEKTSQ